MDIKSATFVISCPNLNSCPVGDKPEYAFIGRSNVGKSTLINLLTQVKELAKTSSKPGKTLLMNYFLINNQWYLVDLPGYGYAKTSLSTREKLHKMVTSYVLKRDALTCLFLLIDSRHKPHPIDLDFIQLLGENGVPFALVFTKIDKISQRELEHNLKVYRETLSEQWEALPPIFTTSSVKQRGRDALLDYIDQINASLQQT